MSKQVRYLLVVACAAFLLVACRGRGGTPGIRPEQDKTVTVQPEADHRREDYPETLALEEVLEAYGLSGTPVDIGVQPTPPPAF